VYLELNHRQTGKTTRLVQAALDHVQNGGYAVLVGHNHEWATQLKRLLAQKIEDEVRTSFGRVECLKRFTAVSGYRSDVFRGLNGRRFWDEYDFIPYVEWRESDYYCTTPKHQETGFKPVIIDTDIDKKPAQNSWSVNMTGEYAEPYKRFTVVADDVDITDEHFIVFANKNGSIVSAFQKAYVIWFGRTSSATL